MLKDHLGDNMLLSGLIGKILDESALFFHEQAFICLAPLDSCVGIGTLTFIEDAKYASFLSDHVTMVLTTEQVYAELSGLPQGFCIVPNPRIAFFKIHNFLSQQEGYMRTQSPSQIHHTAKVSPLAHIDSNNVTIAAGVKVEPFAKIYSDTEIGRNSIIRSGASIGGVGFEFKWFDGKTISVCHSGGTIIGEDVEVQNCASIDRALYPWDNTIIGSSTRIGNQAYVAHGCKIGSRVIVGPQATVGGRNIIGDDAKIGANAGIRQLLTIGNNACINEGAVVTKSVADNDKVTGNFALSDAKFQRLHGDHEGSMEDGLGDRIKSFL